jgi:LAO/AO transport system kinase
VTTVAARGEGVDQLAAEIARHGEYLLEADRRRAHDETRARFVVAGLAQDACARDVQAWLDGSKEGRSLVADVAARRCDPYAATERALQATVARRLPVV